MNVPTVSVLMPVYNRKEYASAAVESVLQQSFGDFEFIIIDDGSTDGVTDLLRKYASDDSRIVLIEQANTGYSRALNRGLQAARGELVARMDSDDVCLPERFQLQVQFLRDHPQVVAVGGQTIVIDEDGDPLVPVLHLTDSNEIEQKLLGAIESRKGALTHPAVMMRREPLLSVGGYRPDFEPAEDRDLWLRLGEIGELANLSETILLYRSHGGSVSHSRAEQQHENSTRAIREAYARRGWDVPQTIHLWSVSERTQPESMARARQALSAARHGNYRTARKLALRVLRKHPLTWTAWKSLIIGILGINFTLRVRRIQRWLLQSPLRAVLACLG